MPNDTQNGPKAAKGRAQSRGAHEGLGCAKGVEPTLPCTDGVGVPAHVCMQLHHLRLQRVISGLQVCGLVLPLANAY